MIPRIGMEVMVAFIDGDPDRPIVVGTVPDPQNNTVPYKLPLNKTRMTLKSNTHKGYGYNELRFEDKTNDEEVFIHTQKDMTLKTLNNHTARIDQNKVTSVGGHFYHEVEKHQNNLISGNLLVSVGHSPLGTLTSQTEKQDDQGIRGSAYNIDNAVASKGEQGNFMVKTTSNLTFSIGKNVDEHVRENKSTQINGKYILSSEKNMEVSSHDSMSVSVSKDLRIDVYNSVTIRCGSSEIKMSKDGNITIMGTKISMKAGKIDLN